MQFMWHWKVCIGNRLRYRGFRQQETEKDLKQAAAIEPSYLMYRLYCRQV